SSRCRRPRRSPARRPCGESPAPAGTRRFRRSRARALPAALALALLGARVRARRARPRGLLRVLVRLCLDDISLRRALASPARPRGLVIGAGDRIAPILRGRPRDRLDLLPRGPATLRPAV